VARTLNKLGDLALAAGTGDARRAYEEALGITVNRSLAFEEAQAREGIGRCLPQPESIVWLEQSLEIYQRIGSPCAGRVRVLLGAGEAPPQL
jgi:hypothetical protein